MTLFHQIFGSLASSALISGFMLGSALAATLGASLLTWVLMDLHT